MTPCATKCAACCEEPHCRSTVVAGTVQGKPAATHALRVTLVDCSPACVTQPPTTSSIWAASTPVRSSSALSACPSRSVGCQPASLPLRLPIGVRTASTITASRMQHPLFPDTSVSILAGSGAADQPAVAVVTHFGGPARSVQPCHQVGRFPEHLDRAVN